MAPRLMLVVRTRSKPVAVAAALHTLQVYLRAL